MGHIYKNYCLSMIGMTSQVSRCQRVLTFIQHQNWKVCHRNYGVSLWEPDDKSGYKEISRKHWEHMTIWEHYKRGMKLIPQELKKLKNETWEEFNSLSISAPPMYHGDYRTLWQFDSEEVVKNWIVSTDNDMLEGFTNAEFVLGPNKTGIYRGYLDTQVPKDGVIKQTGYTSLYCPQKHKSFSRRVDYALDGFSHLVFKVRGDGRTYMVLLRKGGFNLQYDMFQNDMYSFPLFTRGGPYWQYAKIPFSKFLFSHKGRIQDVNQCRLNGSHVAQIGIALVDGNTGPFQLEIASLTALRDESHTENFAYELYPGPSYMFY